ELFLGHHDGGFLIQNQQLKQISTTLGNWKIIPLTKHPDYYLMGTYEGLVLYHKKGNDWKRIKKYDNFKESCRIIEQDQAGNIWVSHPYRGIYKVELAADLSTIKVKLYGAIDGLPSNNLNHVFKINDAIVFTGETGIYKYDEASNRFKSYPELTNLLGPTTSIHRFFEDSKGNIWFVTSEETGILSIDDRGVTKSFTKKVYPELNDKLVRGFEFIYPYDDNNVFIGAEKGFIHYNPSKDLVNESAGFMAHIVKVRAINSADSILIHGQYNSRQSELVNNLSAENNALRFSYVATDYRTKQASCYATKLEGYEDEWSTWSTKTEKDFTNLKPSDYRFLVKAKSIYEEESEIASYSFSINSPWYATPQAITMYVLLTLVFLSGLILVPRRKFQVERAALEATQKEKEIEHQKVVAQSEQAIISLKNEQLEAQIAHKNSELAISTMHLVQRSELIHQLQERLNKVARNTKDVVVSKELRKVNRLLKENTQVDDLWNQFAFHFDQVHIDFLQKVQEKFPQLTANDQKLCAYLKMNLSTKEIAPLMNISIRGVEVARYRLRKKLNLENTINLNKFMLEL
ncbi:MAG: triple tyrosine motif-containing protein, partial [Saprospiraceae bacterium]